MKHTINRWITATATASLLLVLASPALGAPPVPTPERYTIAEYLAEHPGGIPINANEISYSNGAFIVTLNPPARAFAGLPDCPVGWFCFYDRVSYGYPRGRLSSCGWQDLTTWGWQFRAESAYYNMSRGTVAFLYYGEWLFDLDVRRRARPDVTPHRNWANHVRRFC